MPDSDELIEPLLDKVAIAPHDRPGISRGGVLLPDMGPKPRRGTVVAVGPGKRLEDGMLVPLTCKVGDEVVYATHGHKQAKVNNKQLAPCGELIILEEWLILCKIVED